MSRTFNEGSGTKTVTFTEAEQNSFYSFLSTRNSASYRISVDTYSSGGSYMETKSQYGTIYVGAANPQFENFEYSDINHTLLELTGSDQIFIKNHSQALITITPENKAVAVKEAVMSKYRTVIGNQQSETWYHEDENSMMVVNEMNNKTINVYAIDSRGNSKLVQKTIPDENYIEYKSINVKNGKAIRANGGIGTAVTLEFNGEVFEGNFGAKENSIVHCEYRYREIGTDNYTLGETDITPTQITNGTYSNSVQIKGDLGAQGFDNGKSYEIWIMINDELTIANYYVTLGAGKPLVAHHKNGVAFGALYDESYGGLIQFNGSNPMPNDMIQGTVARQYVSTSSSWEIKNLGTLTQSVKKGNKLSIVNGKIKVGAGVKKLLAAGTLTGFNSNQSNGDFNFFLMRNGSAFATLYFNGSQHGWRPRFYFYNSSKCFRRR